MIRRYTVVVFIVLGIAAPVGAGEDRPVTLSPGAGDNEVTIADVCPTFSWTAVSTGKGYELAFYRIREMGNEAEEILLAEFPAGATSWTPSSAECLEPGGRYAWSVRALGQERPSEWSKPRLFRVSMGPSRQDVASALRVLNEYLDGETPADVKLQENAEIPSGVGGGAAAGAIHPPDASSGKEIVDRELFPVADSDRAAKDLLTTKVEPTSSTPAAAPTLGAASLTVDGQVHLSASSHVFRDGFPFLWAEGSNTGIGQDAAASNTTGSWNTAAGIGALQLNTTGSRNTAFGSLALRDNTEGAWNTAIGVDALRENSDPGAHFNTAVGFRALELNSGHRNTAVGAVALASNTDGAWNTAIGVDALKFNTDGKSNTAVGFEALLSNVGDIPGFQGSQNTAIGTQALNASVSGQSNTALGFEALMATTEGDGNTAVGSGALRYATGYGYNTAIGFEALGETTTGVENIAVGRHAGELNDTGGFNIFIGNRGLSTDGTTAGESVIRIGDHHQSKAFIAGIRGTTTDVRDAIPVVIDSLGQLGTVSSSRRFKEEIVDVGNISGGLLDLRPVSFRYRKRPAVGRNPTQFGLIAEEVAEVLPELVVFDRNGQPETVKYHHLPALLLNELQRQHRQIRALQFGLGAVLVMGVGWLATRWRLI